MNNKFQKSFIIFLILFYATSAYSRPHIIETFPKNKSTNLSVSQIYAIADQFLRKEDINIFTVSVNDGKSDLKGSVKYDESQRKIIFTPHFKLNPKNTYRVLISGEIHSKSGETIGKDYSWYFSIGKKIDYSKLLSEIVPKSEKKSLSDDKKNNSASKKPIKSEFKILSITPGNNSTEVSTDQIISIRFNKELDGKSVNKYTVILRSPDRIINGNIEISEGNKVINFYPEKRLLNSKQYTLNISNLIRSLSGEYLKNGLITSFSTIEPAISSPLTITGCYPSNSLVNVSPNSKINIFFNCPINKNTINRLAVRLTSNNKPIWFDYFLSKNLKNLTIQPQKTLPLNSEIMLTLLPTIKSEDGKRLNEPFTLKFHTASTLSLVKTPIIIKKSDYTPKFKEIIPKKDKINTSIKKRIIPADAFSTPRLLESYPYPDQKKIPVNAEFHFRFNKRIKLETINGFNFLLKKGNIPLSGLISYDDKSFSVIFKPNSILKYSTTYTIIITNKVTDNGGKPLDKLYQFSFQTIDPPDTTPPAIINTYPQNGQIKLNIFPVLSAVFSEKINEKTLNSFSVILNDGKYNLPGNISYDPQKNEVFYKPSNALKPSQWYTFSLTPSIKDLAGNRLSNPQKIRFLVGNPPDKTPPIVMAFSPKNGAVIHYTHPVISLSFSEQVDTKDANPFNFYLINSSGKFIPGIIEYSSLSKRLFFTLLEELPYDSYLLNMNFIVKDLAGNKSVINRKIKFEIAKKNSKLTIYNIYPLYGETINNDENISIDFSNEVNPVSLNLFTMKLLDSNGTVVPGNIKYDRSIRKAYFIPKNILEHKKNYTLIITKGIQDLKGRTLDREYKVNFSVK